MSEATAVQQIEAFLGEWAGDVQPMREWFRKFYNELSVLENVDFKFLARPGVSYSMRPKHSSQKDRELFAIVDVIDDEPAERWLSVCFYGDMITDPEERGEVIPGGLAGDDGYCFDMYEDDEAMALYLVDRLKEACAAAA